MSVWLKCGCLYLFHVFIVMSLRGVANGQNYQILKGYNFQANSRLWEDEAPRSLIQCVVVCKQTERCCCVVLTSSTGKCSYHDWFKNDSSYLAVVDGDADDTMILVKSIPILVVWTQYSLLFEEGKARCDALGIRVSSYADLQAAFNRGVDICRCGFLSNGNVHYPSQRARPQCGNKVGIVTCVTKTRRDVYCTKD